MPAQRHAAWSGLAENHVDFLRLQARKKSEHRNVHRRTDGCPLWVCNCASNFSAREGTRWTR